MSSPIGVRVDGSGAWLGAAQAALDAMRRGHG
jgi:hypothetical protein